MIFSPENLQNRKTIFLAGTIDNGNSENWQEKVAKLLDSRYIVFNPRRTDLTSKDYEDNYIGQNQIFWEQKYINLSDIILFNFLPDSKSPITLMELGFAIGRGTQEIVVCCPEKYWKYLNVKTMCDKYKIILYNNLEKTLEHLYWSNK